jgi:hypothetical protein
MGELVLASLLYEALDSEIGIVVETPDAERLRQRLYAERKRVPEFSQLSFVISPMNGRDLWILNKGGTNA